MPSLIPGGLTLKGQLECRGSLGVREVVMSKSPSEMLKNAEGAARRRSAGFGFPKDLSDGRKSEEWAPGNALARTSR